MCLPCSAVVEAAAILTAGGFNLVAMFLTSGPVVKAVIR